MRISLRGLRVGKHVLVKVRMVENAVIVLTGSVSRFTSLVWIAEQEVGFQFCQKL
jgi:hypothetical protein